LRFAEDIALTIRSVDCSGHPTEAMQSMDVLGRARCSAGYGMARISRRGRLENPNMLAHYYAWAEIEEWGTIAG